MSLDGAFKRAFGDEDPSALGTGWVSGVSSVIAGFLALGGVLCFRYPELLTAPLFRAHYPIPLLRALLELLMIASLATGLVSLVRRRRKVLGLTGAALVALALALGGSTVPLPDEVATPVGLGLDWFLLNMLALVLLFVPLERARPHDPEQLVFRAGWSTDAAHFLVSHLLVQLYSFVAVVPAKALAMTSAGAALPLGLQILAVALLADLTQYAVHRAFHRSAILWRFHAIHHSSRALDWLAGSRLHVVDALIMRTLVIAPAILLGFSDAAINAYLVFVSFHAVLIHANVDLPLGWVERFLVTPRVHHFHHAIEEEAIDTNFAVHFPWIDRVFGTQYLPEGRWPRGYGTPEEAPTGFWAQLLAPFRRRP